MVPVQPGWVHFGFPEPFDELRRGPVEGLADVLGSPEPFDELRRGPVEGLAPSTGPGLPHTSQ